MDAGKLDRRITIEREVTTRNEWNEPTSTWTVVGTVWASKEDVSDGEKLRAAEVGATITSRFRVLWSGITAGITPSDRLVYARRVFDISGVKEIGRREGFEITAAASAESLEAEPVRFALGGRSAASAAASAVMGLMRLLGGAASATSSAVANIGSALALQASATASSEAAGSLWLAARLGGSVGAASTSAAGMTLQRNLSGQASAQSGSAVAIAQSGASYLAGSSEGLSGGTGGLSIAQRLLGAAAAVSAAGVAVDLIRRLEGIAAGQSGAAAELGKGNTLTGAASAQSDAAAPMDVQRRLEGAAAAQSTAAGPLALNSAYTFVNPEAAALVARFATQPDSTRKQLIDERFTAGKAKSFWAKLDALWVHAAHGPEAARLNWLGDIYNCVPINNPGFVADRGYMGDGASSYLDTTFNPATAVAPKYTQDSGSLGLRSNTNNDAGGSLAGFYDGTKGTTINPRTSGQYGVRLNTATYTMGGSSTNAIGMFVANRTAAATSAFWRDGVKVLDANVASSSPANGSFRLGAITNSSFRACQFSMGFIGAGLTNQEVQDVYNWFEPYRTAVGVV